MSRFSCRRLGIAALGVMLWAGVLTGCQSDAQSGALLGAGIGALAGQAIGGNTKSTLIGAAAGAGAGAIVGNERDKARAHREGENRQAAPNAPVAERPHTPAPVAANTLVGTTWAVLSLVRDGREADFESMWMTFETGGQLITRSQTSTGENKTSIGTYSVVGETLLLEDEYGNLINATHQRIGNRLVISAPNYSAVLERVPG